MTEAHGGFTVKLTNFEGPFDLLLQLITRHKLDVTEVALSTVTDEFIAHLRAMGPAWDLDQTSSFVVVAATLLDLKAARLLPAGEVEDPEDLAMLEARDLLFARLLQYRAFKVVSGLMQTRLQEEGRRHARPGGLEEAFARLLPEVVIGVDGDQLAWLAARALQPKPEESISLAHLHAPAVSVREQADLLIDRLRGQGTATFRALIADAGERIVVVARFLALLELARQRAVAFDQLTPLGELTVRWTGTMDEGADLAGGIDEFTGVPQQGDTDG
ncbi:segregation/condensation protein A [Propioniciclava coleopterorum]|uniref:Segregation and condensation protein A n=1 Tax=Propioniciclava coleopterorum TaxID=2714937 RepID=A0A6G7YA40_9ACTN|nr:segregation/condensation protein A [Propioniciclava coleopterorum]QIK73663.1 segregation/condensation protein A [Propioniciclava coleopterorum]